MTTRWARFVRGWLAAGCATFVAAFSHVLAGGLMPSVFAVGASLALSGLVCVALAGKTLSLTRLAISVAASQALFHYIFSSSAVPLPAVEHAHHPQAALITAVGDQHHSPSMWLAHVAAAIVTLLALRFAEASFWRTIEIARLFVRTVIAALGVVVTALGVTPRHPVTELALTPPAPSRVLSALRHRGPPVSIVLA